MVKKNFLPLMALLVFADILFLLSAYLFSFWLRFYSSLLPLSKGVPAFQPYLFSLIFIVLAYLITFRLLHLYKKEKIFDEYYKIFKSMLFVFFIFMTFTFVYREISYSRLFILISFFVSFLFVSAGRALTNRLKLYCYKNGYFLTRTLLVCDQKDVALLKRRIAIEHGYLIVAIVTMLHKKAIPILIKQRNIHELIIHLPHSKHSDLAALMDQGGYDVIYKIIPHHSDILTKNIIPEQLGTITLLQIQETPLKGMNLLLKRSFDISLSLFFLLLFSPLFLLLAFLIKISSQGPAIYKQERTSYNKHSFVLYKFKTMITDAEKDTGPVWAADKDFRVTTVGRFLRKTNLDELPQLFNVLRGDMSLVGPRPERPFFIKQFKHKIPRYVERHAIKAGMTGWAQVNGFYGNTSLEERITYDLFYMENWSLFFDIKILFMTLILCFRKQQRGK